MDVVFLITAFVLGFVACYLYMTTGVDQDDN